MPQKSSPTLTKYWEDFLHLVYPEQCLVCETELTTSEQHICSLCDIQLTETSYHLFEEDSEFDKLFWGRIQVASTFALYYFQKKSVIQSLLSQLKYKHAASIGTVFGKRIGKRVSESEKYKGIEVLIPVPLHPMKEFQRGYNQSLALAIGIAETTNLPIDKEAFKRNSNNKSQTRKGRFQRWDNVDSIFTVTDSILQYNHIAIVDDVITTGSTVEALVHSIRAKKPDIQISVLTLAIT